MGLLVLLTLFLFDECLDLLVIFGSLDEELDLPPFLDSVQLPFLLADCGSLDEDLDLPVRLFCAEIDLPRTSDMIRFDSCTKEHGCSIAANHRLVAPRPDECLEASVFHERLCEEYFLFALVLAFDSIDESNFLVW